MSPSEWDTRTDNDALEVLLSSVRTDQPEISVLLVSLALAMPQSHDSSMNDLARLIRQRVPERLASVVLSADAA